MSAKVKSQTGDTFLQEHLGSRFHQERVLLAAETVHENDHRTAFASFQQWLFDDGTELIISTVYHHFLARAFHVCGGKQFRERLFYFVGDNGSQNDVSVRVYQIDRGNPTDTIGFGDVGIFEFLQFADLCVADVELVERLFPTIDISVERDSYELHTLWGELLVHPLHVGNVFQTVWAPRCPKVQNRIFPLGNLTQLYCLPVGRLQLEVGCFCSLFQ